MEFKKITSPTRSKNVITYIVGFLILSFITFFLLNKMNFPSPSKDLEKIISNETFKVVK
jgi:surface polysaccharide O-acyltransferase-like enzyme